MPDPARLRCLPIVLAAALAAAPLAAQQLTLHVNVKLVSIFVNVTDRNGAIVGGLTRDDFALAEDGRPQQISRLRAPVRAAPRHRPSPSTPAAACKKDMSEEADAARRFAHAILRPRTR